MCGGERTLARKAEQLGIFYNATKEMQLHLHYRIQAVNAFEFCICGSPEKPAIYSLFSLVSVVLFPLQHFAAVTQVSGCVTRDRVTPENPPWLQQQEKARAAGAGRAVAAKPRLVTGCSLFL